MNNARLCGPTPESPYQTEATYAAERLENAIGTLDMLIGDLETRLKPVLMAIPSSVTGTVKGDREVSSPIATGLIQTANRVEAQKERIVSLLNSLAI